MFRNGEKVWVRGKPWSITSSSELAEQCSLIKLAPHGHQSKSLEVIYPRELITKGGFVSPQFGPVETTYSEWQRNHNLLELGAIRSEDPLAGLCYGRVALEAYQLSPILRVLSKPRPRLLIADDVGLGKTIEAGLCLLALLSRKWTDRILIVVPPGLIEQWQDELKLRFNFEFEKIDNASGFARAQTKLNAGISPWDVLPRVITSTEYIKKKEIYEKVFRNRWDLVIVDEAHYLAESGTYQNPIFTKRTRLGIELRDKCDGLILLTATPHNGYTHSLRSLIELVEPTSASFSGDAEAVKSRIQNAMIRRMKSQITVESNKERQLKFKKRNVEAIKVDISASPILAVFKKVSDFCSKVAKDYAGKDDEDLVSFAMQIIKKRMLSSRRALEETIETRIKALKSKGADEPAPEKAEIREIQTGLFVSDTKADTITQRLIRASIPKEERQRKSELKKLVEISALLKKAAKSDPKLDALLSFLKTFLANPKEKAIIFTEYLDTLQAIEDSLRAIPEFKDAIVILKGGFSAKKRAEICRQFESDGIRIMLATDAASEGLNLHRKCRCIIHNELPWNPNRLEQRNGRVDRYGQENTPEIRYLYYTNTPEDHVLHRLVEKIEGMQGDMVSTPDTLGVLYGMNIETKLTGLSSGEEGEADGLSLVKTFDDRTAEFTKQFSGLLGSTFKDTLADLQRGEKALLSGASILKDDLGLEDLLQSRLGKAVKEVSPGIYRLSIPRDLRGPEVRTEYLAATCRRSIAIMPENNSVDFLTPAHPLIKAIINEAHRKLLLPAFGDKGKSPRLAFRKSKEAKEAGVLFTFWARIDGKLSSGREIVLEEIMLPVFVAKGNTSSTTPDSDYKLYADHTPPGEVKSEQIEADFKDNFDALLATALTEAEKRLKLKYEAMVQNRAKMCTLMEQDLKLYVDSRTNELTAEEAQRRQVGGQDELNLVFDREFRDIERKRAEISRFKIDREKEIATFTEVKINVPVQPLGALFVYPA